ncbi:MAG: methyltransferase domain-containing protein [Acidobacteriia bacterium]|nr:methyltransferase domain-containing protein [Terriglobia bacterium]
MKAKTILILTIGFGAGHQRAADAVARLCGQSIPEGEAQVVDITPLLPAWFRWFYVDLYLFVIRHFPGLWGGYEARQKKQSHTAPLWMLAQVAKRIHREIAAFDVAAMVSTEVGVNEIAALLKKNYFPKAPLVAVLTDYDVDRAWIQPEVTAFCAGSEEVRDELKKAGAAPERIHVTGIPVDGRFELNSREALDQPETDTPSPGVKILLGGGGESLLKFHDLVDLFEKIPGVGSVTILAGKSATLRKETRRESQSRKVPIEIQPWTDEMFRVLQRHDVLVAKPGGLTLTEAMAAGVPILALDPLPGAEEKHFELVEKWQVGLSARDKQGLREKADRMISDESLRKRMSEKAWQVYVEQHASPVSDVLRSVLGLSPSRRKLLETEFNEWAAQDRGEKMENHHSAIAEATFEQIPWSPCDQVLDLGCGSGWAARRMAQRVADGHVVGVDLAEGMIERARRHPPSDPRVEFRVANVEALPFGDGTFDKVFSCESFYYYPDLRRALKEVWRVLKPGGEFFCLVNLYRENPYTLAWVDLLNVKVHCLGEAEYRKLFSGAGFSGVRSKRIPDQTPIDERQFKPGWGIETLEDLKKYREIGALLVIGKKA